MHMAIFNLPLRIKLQDTSNYMCVKIAALFFKKSKNGFKLTKIGFDDAIRHGTISSRLVSFCCQKKCIIIFALIKKWKNPDIFETLDITWCRMQ